MPEEVFDGIHLSLTGHKRLEFDYNESDLAVAYRRTNPTSWDDLIRWLERFGEADNELTPGETVALVEDLRSLKATGVPFTRDPRQAFALAHKFRSENNQTYAALHQRIVTRSQEIGRA